MCVQLVRPVEPWLAGELRLCWGDKNTFRAYPATPNYYSTKIDWLDPWERGFVTARFSFQVP